MGKTPSPSAIERQDRASSRAADRWFSRLRTLEPPTSSGVNVGGWKKTIGLELRDLRAVDAGPTATILAQAFNSPEGRRYLRLQQKLLQRTQVDYRAWTRLMRKVGLVQACSPHPTKNATTPGSATQLGTTARP
jgi:hypothetical protein